MTATGASRPPVRSYHDLTVELRAADPLAERYTVSLSGAPVGEPAPVPVQLNEAELAEGLADLEDGGIDDEEDLVAFGRALAERLLPEGQVRTKVLETLRNLGPDEGVRLRLLIREPRLAQLPWEYTYLSVLERESVSDFLALNPKVSLVRHEPLPLPAASVVPRDQGHLRLIAGLANAPGHARLQLKRERRVVQKALSDPPGDVARIDYEPFLEDPSADALRQALLGKADLFHFAGHGGFEQGQGFIVLPSPDGKTADRVPADSLGKLLAGAAVRMAMLGACETGRRDGHSPWAGVAAALVAESVPAVVAMQYKIRDDAAVTFARQLYYGLAAGLSVDEAVCWGRLAVYDPDGTSASWGIPVLYHRSPDGLIFSHLAARPSAAADTLRISVKQVIDEVEKGGQVVGIDSLRTAGAMGTVKVGQKIGKASGGVTGIRVVNPCGRGTATSPQAQPEEEG